MRSCALIVKNMTYCVNNDNIEPIISHHPHMSSLLQKEPDASRHLPDMRSVLNELEPVLAGHASAGTPARLVYAAVLEELLVRFEFMANGAQVMEVFNAFNKARPGEMAKLPLGTAGTANDAVSAFRTKLARSYRSRLTLESLPNDMAQKVATLFDQIVIDLRKSVAVSYEASFESAQANHSEEMTALKREWELKHEKLRGEIEALTDKEDESTQLISSLNSKLVSTQDRLKETIAALDSLQSRFQLVSSRETAARVRIETLETRKGELDAEVIRLNFDTAENRRSHLLLIDKNHQLQLARQSDQAAILAGNKRIKELENSIKIDAAQKTVSDERMTLQQSRIANLEIELVAALKMAATSSVNSKKATPKRSQRTAP